MLIGQRSEAVVVQAPAKVNLYLEVLAKRSDGYHEIATLMVAVSLYDTLVFKEENSGDLRLRCDHPGLSTGSENLVLRAARLLRQHSSCQRGAAITLTKRIPLAAGLAGGSTDAAATLAGLNRLWRLGLTTTELIALSAQLGSDVAFFFATPAAWCTGRGERVEALPLPETLYIVLLCPTVGLSTADVYRGVTVPERPLTGVEIRQALAQGQMEAIGRRLHNRLQRVAEGLCPAVAAAYARLEALRPAGQLMSGSGSSLFALCRHWEEAVRIARAIRHGSVEGVRPSVYLVRSCS
jgi:4-diphosphocytidyl-2-C-methyl-D-erythritol kinase